MQPSSPHTHVPGHYPPRLFLPCPALPKTTTTGFYPRILRVEAPVKYQQVQGGAMRVEADAASIRFFERGLGRVWIHPASVCFKAGSYSSGVCGRVRCSLTHL
jgi:hypothetical protein